MSIDVKLVRTPDGHIAKVTIDEVRKAIEESVEEATDRCLAALGPLTLKPDDAVRVRYTTTITIRG